MTNLQLTITAEERQFLASLLETELKQKRVEEHRTRTPNYREGVLHEEELLMSLLNKVRQQPG